MKKINLQINFKQILITNFFKIFELVSLISLTIFIYFFYTYFLTPTTPALPDEAGLPTQNEGKISNLDNYEQIMADHQQKKNQANAFTGYMLNNPFRHTTEEE
ncbi:MAG: hypothetical protein A2233_02500 [Candidatus Kerfeldbacteria bacterium RIFOXYA2_FULL_38_24]|uniref:Uncharacterized protein n=1 Tax=Candidatus Kerfeldbacteria bacterium RIFOXYB2_FULL_38_14 TaxID=1798547 RepID=A0A1G2B9F5_9BACT|nr:MAG: hypothetical protein A2233_02500 [Candidatus Kerfeldbacteria bacterium RIFOXYA2_FULL_38_24]OGY85834.1 MAG: hypothetical protein A2319_05770 [Candidatus Kerfeldbacteria bacterium RIFOXYB2_FULL_38_14]OGY89126.1 MAG: hypothetical protein A2458_02615 [Candidatus Kerfeldbacteria bacterium RIFOXYC2_FULL_38_9]